MNFTYMRPLPPQNFPIDRMMPVAEILGVGPGYVSVQFSAVPIRSANDSKYVIGS